jgi:hypothetical protein
MASDQLVPEAGRVLPQADFPVEDLTVVLLFEGPKAAGMDHDTKQRIANEHLRYTIGLVAAGHLVHAGAIVDEAGEPPVTGLGFSREAPEAVAALVAEDPGMKSGLESFRVVQYRFPKGGLRFAREMPATGEK